MHDLILLHRHAFCKIPRLINIKSFRHAHIVAQQLQGHDSKASYEMFIHSWDIHSEINMILRFILAEGGKTHQVGAPTLALDYITDGLLIKLPLGFSLQSNYMKPKIF